MLKEFRRLKNDSDQFAMFQNGPNCPKWSKMVQMVQNGPKWSKMIQNGQISSKIVQNHPKCFKYSKLVQTCQNGSGLVRTCQDGSGRVRTSQDGSGRVRTHPKLSLIQLNLTPKYYIQSPLPLPATLFQRPLDNFLMMHFGQQFLIQDQFLTLILVYSHFLGSKKMASSFR